MPDERHPAPQTPRRLALISVHGDPAAEIGKEEAGGQNVYVRHVGEALAQRGWQVDMLTRRAHPDEPEIVEHLPGCRTVRLEAGPVKFVPRDDLFEFLPAFVERAIAFAQAEYGSSDDALPYRVLHTNYWLSSWVGMQLHDRFGLPQVHTYHSLGAVKYRTMQQTGHALPPVAETRLAVEKRCLETASCVVATSPQEAADMRSLVSAGGTVDIIPCGTDIDRFGRVDRALAREKLGLPAEAKIPFYVGRFDRRKGIETLVEAVGRSRFARSDDFLLTIGGGSRPDQSDGDERRRIEARVAELGLGDRVRFTGRIPDAELPLYYAAADLSVVPSYYEPFGLVALEAMASRTPVVASDVGGLQFSVADGETGLLVPARNEAALAAAIDCLLADPDWRDRLGAAARRRVEREFSWDSIADRLDDLYERLVAATTSAA